MKVKYSIRFTDRQGIERLAMFVGIWIVTAVDSEWVEI